MRAWTGLAFTAALAMAAGPLAVSAAPAGAGQPGDNDELVWTVTLDAFESHPDFEVAFATLPGEGDEATRVTHDPGRDWFPDLSPDHASLVWQSDRSGKFEIYGLSAASGFDDLGTGLRQLTTTPGKAESTLPVFSPDGSKIAFVSDRDGKPGLYVMAPDGSDVQRVGTFVATLESRPSWAPDGTRIAFAGTAKGKGKSDILVADLTSGKTRKIGASPKNEIEPAWSPDGKHILFFRGVTVWVMKAKGTGAHKLIKYDEKGDVLVDAAYQADWSPDGTGVVYVANRPDGSSLFIVDADGSNPLRLTPGESGRSDEAPSWR